MRRICRWLIIAYMLHVSGRIILLDLHQQRINAMERLHLLRSAEIVLEIPLTGNMTWKDMMGR